MNLPREFSGFESMLGQRKHRERRLWAQHIEKQQEMQAEQFRLKAVAMLPLRWARSALREWERRRIQDCESAANRWLLGVSDRADQCRIAPDASDSDICDLAKRQAVEAASLMLTFKGTNGRSALERFCQRQGVTPPAPTIDDAQAIARMADEHWWRRQLRRIHNEQSENLALSLGYVHIKAGPYCSNEALARRQQQNRRNRNTLESTLMANDDGEVMSLAEIADTGMANKALRRAELMTRAKGCEDIARELGHLGLFVTITCPSRMHARMYKSSLPNPRHDGTTPKEGRAYLQRNWERIRAKFERLGIRPYGLRIAEPHHDGTPHWHMLMFLPPEQQQQAIAIMRDYALQDSPDERGAQERRFTVEAINPERGSAVGYLVKYVCKNIDGEGLEADLDGVPAHESAARTEAWARAHGIRQFQAFGMPAVSTWRELRRIPREHITDAPAAVQQAHEAAQKTEDRQADFAGFIRASGGVGLKRSDYLLTVAMAEESRQGRYGPTIAARPVGVAMTHCPERVFRSNRRTWSPLRRAKMPEVATPWTCVNNCTPSRNQRLTVASPPWWNPAIEYESTASDADGYRLGFFAPLPWGRANLPDQKAEKKKGSNSSAPAELPPYHPRMIEAFAYGFQTE